MGIYRIQWRKGLGENRVNGYGARGGEFPVLDKEVGFSEGAAIR
jgi:hypothetical protein